VLLIYTGCGERREAAHGVTAHLHAKWRSIASEISRRGECGEIKRALNIVPGMRHTTLLLAMAWASLRAKHGGGKRRVRGALAPRHRAS